MKIYAIEIDVTGKISLLFILFLICAYFELKMPRDSICKKHLALLQVKYNVTVMIACNGQTSWPKGQETSET